MLEVVKFSIEIVIKYISGLEMPMNYSLSWNTTKFPSFESYMVSLMDTILLAEEDPNKVDNIFVKSIELYNTKEQSGDNINEIIEFCKKNGVKIN